MSRVLHCLASLEIGGVESSVLGLFHHLAQHGSRHEHFLCAFRGGRLADTGLQPLHDACIPVRVLDRPSRFSWSFWRSLRRTVAELQPHIIHAYNPTAALWTRVALGRTARPRIVVHCGSMGGLGPRWRFIERALLSRTDAFVFSSQSIRAVWEHALPIYQMRKVIYHGLDLVGREAAMQTPSLSPFTLLTVCRLVAIKNLGAQVQALRLLHDRGLRDTRLIVVGDGPARAACESHIRLRGLADAVDMEGFQSRPRDYHGRAHAYLCTSYSEGLSISLNEAMLDGMVCIASRVGGNSELITDGVDGFLVPCTEPVPRELRGTLPAGQTLPGRVYDHTTGAIRPPAGIDVTALADRIQDVRARFETLVSVRAAARSRILNHFSMERNVESLDELYGDLID
ncbi:MAG: glycosyltransferase [Phycisphaerales bacterium]|nr:glycosyltransferase [Phycisphaerales bacterium]